MTEATNRTPELVGRLLQVWEDSARATHLFLSDAEIKDIIATPESYPFSSWTLKPHNIR